MMHSLTWIDKTETVTQRFTKNFKGLANLINDTPSNLINDTRPLYERYRNWLTDVRDEPDIVDYFQMPVQFKDCMPVWGFDKKAILAITRAWQTFDTKDYF